MIYVINLTKRYVSHETKDKNEADTYVSNSRNFTQDQFIIVDGAKNRDQILKGNK